MDIKKFEVGKVYFTRSYIDYDYYYDDYEIISRTDKSMVIKYNEKSGSYTRRKKIYIHGGKEYCLPCGDWSMCPVLTADNVREVER